MRSARSRELIAALQAYESRNVTYLAEDFPVFWESAHGATVFDVDGNRYVDLTAALGVANAGHSNPAVAGAIAQQAERLMHGMGDVHPTAVRTKLLQRLAAIVPAGLTKTFLASTGAEAIEAALKTAMLATGRSRFASYRGGYHGLSFGALAVCGIEKFRQPFAAALGEPAVMLEYSSDVGDVLGACGDVAALVIEPIQGRAGCILPPDGYLAAVRSACNELGIVMIVDEIYTGFGRTGTWFAVEHDRVVPDIICIGKAMACGFPISAAVGRPEIMDAWPLSSGEALHTSTYLGNPMGCAAALATIDEIERLALPARARELGMALGSRLKAFERNVDDVRGRGLLWALQLHDARTAERVMRESLAKGVIVLQSGSSGDVIAITPPLVIAEEELFWAVDVLEAVIDNVA